MRTAAVATLRLLPRVAKPASRAVMALPPRFRRRLTMLLVAALALAALYIGWFRDSGLVAVEKVTITGLTTSEADRVRTVLTAAARDMTTLHVRPEELEDAARGFGVVHSIEAEPDFPHGLRIHVVERRAVALVEAHGRRVPVAADGTFLVGLPVDGRLPVLKTRAAQKGKRVEDAGALMALRVIRAAPTPVAERILRVKREPERGVVAELRRGPDVILGSLADLRAKWIAATRVLADGAARGATYVDVRLPERPAAGGLGEETVEPAGAEELQAAAAAAQAAAPAAPAPAPIQPETVVPTTPETSAPPAEAPPQAPPTTPPEPAPGTAEGGATPAP